MEIKKTLDIELEIDPKVYWLDGHVTCGGQPVAGCIISFHRSDGVDANDVTTDVAGYYRTQFLPGEWTATVQPPEGYKPKTINFTMP